MTSRKRKRSDKRSSGKSGKSAGKASRKSGRKPSRSRSEKGQKRRGRTQGGAGPLLQGKVQKNPKGFAFILPTEAGFPDAYVGQSEAAKLLNDDIVEFRMQHRGPRAYARIERIVKRGRATVVGQLVQRGPTMEVTTSHGESLQVGDAGDGRSGDWVVARISKYPTEDRPAIADVEKSFGRVLSSEHDVELTVARYGLQTEFSDDAIKDAEAGDSMMAAEIAKKQRTDLRSLPLVTIDGEDAKDFDDAVCVETPKGQVPA